MFGLALVGFLGFGLPQIKPGTQVPFWVWPFVGSISFLLLHRRSVTIDPLARTLSVSSWRPWRREDDTFALADFKAIVLGDQRETKQGLVREAYLSRRDGLFVCVTTLKGNAPHPDLDKLVQATGLPVQTACEFTADPAEEPTPLCTEGLYLSIPGAPGVWPIWGLLVALSLVACPALVYFGITQVDKSRPLVSLGLLSLLLLWFFVQMAGLVYYRGLSTRVWVNGGSLHIEQGGKALCKLSLDSLDEVMLDVRKSPCTWSACEVVVIAQAEEISRSGKWPTRRPAAGWFSSCGACPRKQEGPAKIFVLRFPT